MPQLSSGRPSKTGKVVDEDDEEEFDEDIDLEDFDGHKSGPAPLAVDSIIEMASERAKKSLARIELFDRLRSPAIQEHESLLEILTGARRSGGLAR